MIKVIKVKGCSFHQEGFEGLESGLTYEAFLRPELDNEYDPNAVAVYINEKKVGYLPMGWWDKNEVLQAFMEERIYSHKVISAEVIGGFIMEDGSRANYGVLLYLI